jgi:hypothetical protein
MMGIGLYDQSPSMLSFFFEQGRAPKDPEAALNIIGGNTFYKEDL